MLKAVVDKELKEIIVKDKDVRVFLKAKLKRHKITFRIMRKKASLFCVADLSSGKCRDIDIYIEPLKNKEKKLEWITLNFVFFIEDSMEREINIDVNLSKIEHHEIYLRKVVLSKESGRKMDIKVNIRNPNNVTIIEQETVPFVSKEDYDLIKKGYLKEVIE